MLHPFGLVLPTDMHMDKDNFCCSKFIFETRPCRQLITTRSFCNKLFIYLGMLYWYWVSFLVYPNLFETKIFVVVVACFIGL
jgi:hypothetical protein